MSTLYPKGARHYGGHKTGYIPLHTSLDPRTPFENDVYEVGADTVGVVLQDGNLAVLDKLDYELLRRAGWIGRMTSRKVTGNNTYPSINHGSRILPVSRLILAAAKGERVSYVSDDRFDLRRSNLVLKGPGGCLLDADTRRAAPAPSLTAEDRRKARASMSSRANDRASAETATQNAIGRAAPKVTATRHRLGQRPRVDILSPVPWWHRAVAMEASAKLAGATSS